MGLLQANYNLINKYGRPITITRPESGASASVTATSRRMKKDILVDSAEQYDIEYKVLISEFEGQALSIPQRNDRLVDGPFTRTIEMVQILQFSGVQVTYKMRVSGDG